jgi:hypothetical protein
MDLFFIGEMDLSVVIDGKRWARVADLIEKTQSVRERSYPHKHK